MSNLCVLSTNGNGNDDTNAHNIIFTINNSKLNVPVVTLSVQRQSGTMKNS